MVLLDEARIERTLKRMAYQVVEMAHGFPVYMVALNERGTAVASSMKNVIEKVTGKMVPVDTLNTDKEGNFELTQSVEPECCLVIVDDVIFSGETIQRAMDRIDELHNFRKICVSVLVDRGHRKYPVFAEIVGVNVPTKLNEQVNLLIKNQQPDSVILEQL
ncbi:MAG: phosphoribosyltransferase family protein [Balneolaceae bacterium]|nr:phosphoribosyltransferase family protein [Balneolaceae bacterium]